MLAWVFASNCLLASEFQHWVQVPSEIERLTDNRICHILLGTLRLNSQERGHCLAWQSTTNLTRAGCAKFLKNNWMFLAKPTRVQEHWSTVSLKPPLASKDQLW
jgi:hypothetical protein